MKTKTNTRRLSTGLLAWFALALFGMATLSTGCDFRKYYYGHKKECDGKDCDGCGDAPTYPRGKGDGNDTPKPGDTSKPGETPKPGDKLGCLQSCYEQGKGKDACQKLCNDTSSNPGTGDGSGSGSGSGDGSGSGSGDGSGSGSNGGSGNGGNTGDKPPIDQGSYNACLTKCKQEGEVSCVCESRCRSMARGVWVSKCWETCATSGQDIAVCKKKCDA